MPNIVVVHGALGSALQMQPVADALRALGTVFTVELPGHGATPLGDCAFSIDTFVKALAESVELLSYPAAAERGGKDVESASHVPASESIDVTKPFVFGYSMGGYVALALEAQRPGTFGAIITLGTKFAWTPDIAERDTSRLNAAVMLEKVPKFAAVLAERHAECGGWREMLANTERLLSQLGDAPLLTNAVLSGIAIPVCIAVGELDDTVSAQEAATVAGWMERGTATVLPGAPHPIEKVAVRDIVQLVRRASLDC